MFIHMFYCNTMKHSVMKQTMKHSEAIMVIFIIFQNKDLGNKSTFH